MSNLHKKSPYAALHRSVNRSELDKVVGAASLVWNQKPQDIVGRRRTGAFIEPRHSVMMVLYERGHSMVQIGKALDGRDHGAVLHGLRNVRAWIETDKKFRKRWEAFQRIMDEADNGPKEVVITLRGNIPGFRSLSQRQVLLAALKLVRDKSPRAHSVTILEDER